MNWKITSFEDGRSFEFIHTADGLKGSIAIFQVEPKTNGSRVNVPPLYVEIQPYLREEK